MREAEQVMPRPTTDVMSVAPCPHPVCCPAGAADAAARGASLRPQLRVILTVLLQMPPLALLDAKQLRACVLSALQALLTALRVRLYYAINEELKPAVRAASSGIGLQAVLAPALPPVPTIAELLLVRHKP